MERETPKKVCKITLFSTYIIYPRTRAGGINYYYY